MFTVTKLINVINGKELVEAACLSTDDKYGNVANGSICIEMDTGKIFMFNEAGSAWVELA